MNLKLLMILLAIPLRLTQTSGAAEPKDSDRYSKVASELIDAINREDFKTIEERFNPAMQQALPADKAGPFFRGLVAAKGKLLEAGKPQMNGRGALVRITAERGAWNFAIALEASGRIGGLQVKPAADVPAGGTDRYSKVAKELIDAINHEDFAAIQAKFNAAMQEALPADKAAPFFRDLVAAKGKLKEAGKPKINGPAAVVPITAERGAWDFAITLDSSGKIGGLVVNASSTDITATTNNDVPHSRTPMQLPFIGQWYVFWGGDNERVNYHAVVPGQRRAADLLIKGPDEKSHRGSGRRNEDYFVYGKEVLAAATGTVVAAIDGVPENAPGSMNPLCAVGNCLIIDQGQNEFAVYAHLQPGSLRVHAGDKVAQGQVLGLCGNSGNSSEPHLHFHLQDSAVLQDGVGITPYFTNVKCRRGGATLSDAEYTFLQGDRIEPAVGK